MKSIFFISFFFLGTAIFGQEIDTLTFFSKAFNKERTVYIKTPRDYKYKSDSVRFPVIYILDGQHSWFVDPILNTFSNLQITKDVPQSVLVIIPHDNRISESRFEDLETLSPLHSFITKDLESQLESYAVNDYRAIIGHSFTASFALKSYLKEPGFYEAVIAHTPLYKFRDLVRSYTENDLTGHANIFISMGGEKDQHHRKNWDMLMAEYPTFFNEINSYMAEHSSHNAVPIAANPAFLTQLFFDYSKRFYHIAEVNENYELTDDPKSIEIEIEKILSASFIADHFYAPEIADLNGIASRFKSNAYPVYAQKIYQVGLRYYPKFWGFHISLYQLLLDQNMEKAQYHLEKAEQFLDALDRPLPEYDSIKTYIAQKKISDSD